MEYWDVYTLINDREPDNLISYVGNLIPDLDLEKEIGEYTLDIGAEELKMTTAKEFIFSGCFHATPLFCVMSPRQCRLGWWMRKNRRIIFWNFNRNTIIECTRGIGAWNNGNLAIPALQCRG